MIRHNYLPGIGGRPLPDATSAMAMQKQLVPLPLFVAVVSLNLNPLDRDWETIVSNHFAIPYNDSFKDASRKAAMDQIIASTGTPNHPPNILNVWTDIELAIHGVYRVDVTRVNWQGNNSQEVSVDWIPNNNRVTKQVNYSLKPLSDLQDTSRS